MILATHPARLASALAAALAVSLWLASPAPAAVSFARTDYAPGTFSRAVAIGDLDRDGTPDLAVADRGSGQLLVLIGDGSGGFADPVGFPANGSAYSIALGDLNADGKLDAALTDANGGVDVLLGDGHGGFGGPIHSTAGSNSYGVAMGNLDADGAPDLAVANADSDDVSFLRA
ncbi:MAG: hypothetical protein QOC68_690, partial [Solirubrobacteraceae bacterium]|nr:hypothetical protein [Solirubrobacteraceae bacterium]